MKVRRLEGNPIVHPNIDEWLGSNINGPSIMRAPDWIEDPLGRYYLYFADHRGEMIHLAYADDFSGPWTRRPSGVLDLDEAGCGFDDHVASPDVHIDPDQERVRMYYHGCCDRYQDATGETNQYTRLAVSANGLEFDAQPEPLGRFYFRMFDYGDYHYALAKENAGEGQRESGQRIYRSRDAHSGFEPGPILFKDGARHTAVRRRGDRLDVFYSRIGDAPECILHAVVDLSPEWLNWTASEPETVLEPEREWEGVDKPTVPSKAGPVFGFVCQLRDPAIFCENGRTYLLYSVAGERGIAIAELLE